jgi:hypothetical protein
MGSTLGITRITNPSALRIGMSNAYRRAAFVYSLSSSLALCLSSNLDPDKARWHAKPGETLATFIERILDELQDCEWPEDGLVVLESDGFWQWNISKEPA